MSEKMSEMAQENTFRMLTHGIEQSKSLVQRTPSAICSKPRCDEPISATRQKLGAIYCIDCQEEEERRGRR